jgi:inorganic pyrophosphatase
VDRYPTISPIIDNSGYTTKSTGELGTGTYRLNFYKDEGTTMISPWHDIPLKGEIDGTYNAVIEIPKMTRSKFEIKKEEAHNPIKQDVQHDKVRFYHGPIYWNYGAMPQTWENNLKTVSIPGLTLPEVVGDGDPIDIVEIGSTALPTGTIAQVKILGALGLIDKGQMDWKIIVLRTEDPLFTEHDDIDDVPKAVRDGIMEWFRWYKSPDGHVNHFANNDEWYNKTVAQFIIESLTKIGQGNVPANDNWVV